MDEEALELIPGPNSIINSSPESTGFPLFAELGEGLSDCSQFYTRIVGLMEFDSVIVAIVMIVPLIKIIKFSHANNLYLH